MGDIEADVSTVRQKILKACRAIAPDYMLLPVYGLEDPQYRERVYCYELYHQLRTSIPGENFLYSLSGEVDKSGHPLIRGNYLDQVKPDLIIHVPGDMDRNLCVIEVKPINAGVEDVADDFRKLSGFCNRGKYHSACFLLYGKRGQDSLDTVSARLQISAELPSHREHFSISLITCYWHSDPGKDPVQVLLPNVSDKTREKSALLPMSTFSKRRSRK